MSLALTLGMIINGICTGGLYGLASAAFSFQFGSLNIINFAYGSVTMIGMYVTFSFVKELGMNPVIFLILFLVLFFLFGYLMRTFFLKTANGNVQLIITTGFSLFFESIALFKWGALPRTLIDTINPTWKINLGKNGILVIGKLNILTVVLSLVILVGFAIFLKRTWMGMTIRAVVQQREISYLMGIDSEKVISIGFGISFIINAFAALMIALQFPIEPTSGHYYQLMGFLVCLIAGMGNLKGGFIAGIMVGILSTIVNMYAAQWHDPIVFMLFVIILTFFPNGLLKSKKSISRAV